MPVDTWQAVTFLQAQWFDEGHYIYKRDQKTIVEKIPNVQNIWSNDSKLHSKKDGRVSNYPMLLVIYARRSLSQFV